MELAILGLRVLLAGVFLGAGIAKLCDLAGSRKAVQDFGLPKWAAKPIGIGLPLLEAAVGCMLLAIRSVWIGSIGALFLLLSFIAAIGINLGLGRRPNCHCFGQIHSEPVGFSTLVRNVILALLATALVWKTRTEPGLSIRSVLRGSSPSQLFAIAFSIAMILALVALGWLMLNLFRQNGRLLLRIEALEAGRTVAAANQPNAARPVPRGLPIGAKAIPFELPQVGGGRTTLDDLLSAQKPLLLISTDPNCGPCGELLPDIAAWQRGLAAELNVVLLSHGSTSDNKTKAVEHGLIHVLIEKDHKIAEKYHALGTPTGVLIRSDGTIGSPAMGGADGIRQLIAHKAWTETGLAALMKSFAPPPQPASPKPMLPTGSLAPPFALPDLDGNVVESASFNGNGTMLVFWNPACGFCQRMLPQLKDWEKSKPERAPRLMLVSNGSLEVNRAMGIESTILIDEQFAVGQMYGAGGTPSGLLIDKQGKIAGGLAVGEPAIMEILTRSKQELAGTQTRS